MSSVLVMNWLSEGLTVLQNFVINLMMSTPDHLWISFFYTYIQQIKKWGKDTKNCILMFKKFLKNGAILIILPIKQLAYFLLDLEQSKWNRKWHLKGNSLVFIYWKNLLTLTLLFLIVTQKIWRNIRSFSTVCVVNHCSNAV